MDSKNLRGRQLGLEDQAFSESGQSIPGPCGGRSQDWDAAPAEATQENTPGPDKVKGDARWLSGHGVRSLGDRAVCAYGFGFFALFWA